MPGIRSLQEKQYYAHERNAFWLILFKLFNTSFSNKYESRVELLSENGIALWDTLQYCYREGSLDSNIKNARPNMIPELLEQNPQIANIIFNGRTAEKFYDKFHARINRIGYYCLPSTSPANATMKIEAKLVKWALIKELM
jgi:double-stranded uracil-DNA glycosylase